MPSDGPDPMTVVSIYSAGDPPGLAVVGICRRSTAARLAADAGDDGQVTDHGPAALLLSQLWEREPRRSFLGAGIVRVGVTDGAGHWLAWFLPSFVPEPPPGSPASTAAGN
jgi:hypothetical protein